ncbi:MAG: glycosyltransferase [Nanoarchaeota archaeon]|nr:glycosyltransferase [Nanoarchaeota archaeon]
MAFIDFILYFAIFFGLFTGIFFILTFFENKKYIADPKASKFPKVSIIVPAYNEEKTIKKTLNSLLNVNYPKDKLDIIFVDDGSKDNTLEKAKEYEKFGVRIFHKENGGKASALNLGLEKAKGELVAALDADSFVSKNSVMNMVGYFEDSEVMAVTPTLKIYNPKTLWQKIQVTEYLFGVFLRKVFSFMGSLHVTPGPLTIYRKSFFDKYGNYDEGNLTEDIEVALRIQSKGYVIENSMNADVYTLGPPTFKKLIRQRRRWYRGFLDNVFAYPELFNPKHGNLGLFILPAAFISVIVVFALVSYWAYNFLSNVFLHLITEPEFFLIKLNLFITNIPSTLLTYTIKPLIPLSVILTLIGLTYLLLAKVYSNEKQSIKIPYISYLIFYGVLFASWWSVAIFSKIFNMKIKW